VTYTEELLSPEEIQKVYQEWADLPDDTVGCETVHGPCDKPVAWLSIMSGCCNHRVLLCDEHKRRAERSDTERHRLSDALLNGKPLLCAYCGKPSEDPTFIPV
jgi:hypothetical protein